MGDYSLYYRHRSDYIYNNNDNHCSIKMNRKALQFLSLIISSLTLLYLLFINVFRGSFISSDWVVVSVDLMAKIIIESVIVFRRM